MTKSPAIIRGALCSFKTLREWERVRRSPHPPRSGPPSPRGEGLNTLRENGCPERGVKLRIAGGITSLNRKRSPFPYEGKALTPRNGSFRPRSGSMATLRSPQDGSAAPDIRRQAQIRQRLSPSPRGEGGPLAGEVTCRPAPLRGAFPADLFTSQADSVEQRL